MTVRRRYAIPLIREDEQKLRDWASRYIDTLIANARKVRKDTGRRHNRLKLGGWPTGFGGCEHGDKYKRVRKDGYAYCYVCYNAYQERYRKALRLRYRGASAKGVPC